LFISDNASREKPRALDATTMQQLSNLFQLVPAMWWGGRYYYVTTAALSVVGAAVLLSAFIFWLRWRGAAKRKFKEIQSQVPSLVMMKRVKLTTAAIDDDEENIGNTATSCLAQSLDLASGYAGKVRRLSSTGDGSVVEVMSLGEYLSSLRPVGPAKAAQGKAVELLLGAALLKALGPSVGKALLPALGVLPGAIKAAAGLGGVAVAAAAVGTRQTEEEKEEMDTGNEGNNDDDNNGKKRKTVGERLAVDTTAALVRAVGGLSILATASVADLASAVARARSGWDGRSTTKSSSGGSKSISADDDEGSKNGDSEASKATQKAPKDPLVIMRRGETDKLTFPSELVPNPFVLSEHWAAAVRGLEDAIIAERGDSCSPYDPDERTLGEPIAIRNMLLPDLHVGMGGVSCTHTNREILENRLLSVLLNRLATVDVLAELDGEEGDCPAKPFAVQAEPRGKKMYRPDELVRALIDVGHRVEASATTRVTTFGLYLCVKEEQEDHSEDETSKKGPPTKWIQVPLGFSLRTGIQHPETGRNVSAFMTHGAVDLTVRGGPLIQNAMLQYYHNQEGFDGWSSGHYPEAEWVERAVGSRRLDDPVRAVRVAGLLSCCENSVGSRFRLPLGGYGLTGCCTDSAAAVEFALTGSTGVYPVLGIGSYKSHVVRRANELRVSCADSRRRSQSGADSKRNDTPPSAEVENDAAALCNALRNLPNDVHPLPSSEAGTARRILASCVPEENPPFQLMESERSVLQEVASDQYWKSAPSNRGE